jgi:hypothetical protein
MRGRHPIRYEHAGEREHACAHTLDQSHCLLDLSGPGRNLFSRTVAGGEPAVLRSEERLSGPEVLEVQAQPFFEHILSLEWRLHETQRRRDGGRSAHGGAGIQQGDL